MVTAGVPALVRLRGLAASGLGLDFHRFFLPTGFFPVVVGSWCYTSGSFAIGLTPLGGLGAFFGVQPTLPLFVPWADPLC